MHRGPRAEGLLQESESPQAIVGEIEQGKVAVPDEVAVVLAAIADFYPEVVFDAGQVVFEPALESSALGISIGAGAFLGQDCLEQLLFRGRATLKATDYGQAAAYY